ncbi:MAG: AAA family ATPase [Anaerolineae bacterium]|nr:AAA family ATPase [Anaerolineae bacterium]
MSGLLETLASYIPGLTARRLVDDPAPISAPFVERFSAAVMFADISGFTVMAERFAQRGPAGAEELSQLLNAYFGQLIDLIAAHGGDVVKFTGDGLLALWLPEMLAEDLTSVTLRAAQCGLAIQHALHNSEVIPGVHLSLRVGIGVGEELLAVHIGGVFGRWEFLVAGEPVVSTGQAERDARPGWVVLSSRAWELIGERGVGHVLPSKNVWLTGIKAPLALRPAPSFALPPDREAALRAYIPGAILSRLAAGQAGWLAELRLVTVLFVNLPDMDHAMSLREAQETIRVLQSALYHYEGSINKLNVDNKGVTLIAALGLPPLAHEDDAVLGVQAALAMQARLQERGWRSAIGVASGRAFCGSVGNAARREYTMVGDVVNLACRLMEASDAGILCDKATYDAAQGRLAFDALPAITVKGKVDPVPVYRPLSQLQTVAQPQRRETIVGREMERMMMVEHLQSMQRSGQGGVVILEGEAGIGKSRLVDELRRQAEELGVKVLYGAGDSIEHVTPYYAWRSIFWQLFGLSGLPPEPDARRQHVFDHLSFDPELILLAPLLNAVLPLDLAENEITAAMTGQVRADNTQELLIRLLQQVVGEGEQPCPHLIVLEDAHWLDSASWNLALAVSRRVQPALLFISTRPLVERPEAYQQLDEELATHRMQLGALSPRDVVTLVGHRLGVPTVPEPIVSLIQDKAQGNPFFCEELAYALRDARLVLIANGECRINPAAGDLSVLDLPDTVQGVITSRIDRLTPSQQFTLKVASVIGRIFASRMLLDIYPIEVGKRYVADDLSALRKLDLTPLETPEPEMTYIFKHIITREVAYNLISFAQRRDLHRAVAEWYERCAQELSPYYPMLAHHWSLALDERRVDPEVAQKAVGYLEKAGEQALRNDANREAVEFFDRTLRLDILRHPLGDPLRRARWERQMGQAYLGMGQIEESQHYLQQALLLLGRPVPATRARLIAALVIQLLRQIWHRLRSPRAVRYPPEVSTRMLETARAYGLLVEIYYFTSAMVPGIYAALRTLNLAERAGLSPELARSFSNMCMACGVSGFHALARMYSRQARETAQAVGELATQAWTLTVESLYQIGVGSWETARESTAQAVAMWQRLGDWHRLGETMGLVCWIDYFAGAFAASMAAYREIESMARQRDDVQQLFWGLIGQAEGLLRQGHAGYLERADALLEEVLTLLEARIGRVEEVRAYGVLALFELRCGERQRARQAADEAMERMAQAPPVAVGMLEGYAGTAEACLALWEGSSGSAAGARRELGRAARDAGRMLRAYARVFPVGRPRAWLLQGRYEWRAGRPARARRAWQRGLVAARQMGMPYEEGLLHLEAGLRAAGVERKQHLAQAVEIMRGLDAAYDLARAQAALES